MPERRGEALVLPREPFQLRRLTAREQVLRAGEQRIEMA